MKINSTITDLTKQDLVDLISTACYGSTWLDFQYDKNKCPDLKEDDCAEDIAAKILLAGGTIEFVDYNAEDPDEIYNSKAYYETDAGIYPVTLEDIKKGLENALNGAFGPADWDERARVCEFAHHIPIGALDNDEAEILMQIVLFNEIIY